VEVTAAPRGDPVPVLVGGVVRSALWGDMVVAFHPGPGREDVERRDAFQTAVFD
jgi:hypothetical protein